PALRPRSTSASWPSWASAWPVRRLRPRPHPAKAARRGADPLVVGQIPPPLRIPPVGAVVFLAAWVTALPPQSASTGPPAAPPAATATAKPTDAFGKAVAKAKGAVAQSNAASQRDGGETQTQTQTQAETGSTAKTTPAQPAIAIPAKVLATLPKDV